jgi:hypothetical protein
LWRDDIVDFKEVAGEGSFCLGAYVAWHEFSETIEQSAGDEQAENASGGATLGAASGRRAAWLADL